MDMYVACCLGPICNLLHGSRHLTKFAWELVIGPNLYRNPSFTAVHDERVSDTDSNVHCH